MSKKIVLITGASRGIGAAIAKKFAANDYIALINYCNNHKAAKKVQNEIESLGGEALLLQADLALETEITQMFQQIAQQYGRLDCLVNNAAICDSPVKVINMQYEQLEKMFKVNSLGTILCSREALKIMSKQQSGNIINITSEAAKFGGMNMSHYAASKAAIDIFTKSLAKEVAEYNIRVNTVSPAIIDTEMHKDITDERKKYLEGSIPLKRMGNPSEVAEVVYWLSSGNSTYVSGSNITVSGAR